jgi:hypothetical protein
MKAEQRPVFLTHADAGSQTEGRRRLLKTGGITIAAIRRLLYEKH